METVKDEEDYYHNNNNSYQYHNDNNSDEKENREERFYQVPGQENIWRGAESGRYYSSTSVVDDNPELEFVIEIVTLQEIGFELQRELNLSHSEAQTARLQDVSVKLEKASEMQLMKINKGPEAEKFYCTVCSKSYEHKGSFLKHCMNKHEKYPCCRCLKMFRSKHNSRVHPCLDRNMYMCRVCPLSYQTKEELTRHWSTHQGRFFCDLCLSAYNSKSSLKSHSLIHENETYECELCEKEFKALSTLNKHISTYHFSCNVCAELFPTKQELKRHVHVHKKKPSAAQLDSCESVVSTKDDKKKHNGIDIRMEEYSCNLCHESFNAKRLLNLHILDYHIDKESKTALFTCDICAETYFKKKDLKEHFMTHTEEERQRAIEVDQRSSSDRHKCPICSKSLGTQKMLSIHMLHFHGAGGIYACNYCPETFERYRELKQHMLSHENDENNNQEWNTERTSKFFCDLCSEYFENSQDLEEHSFSVHRFCCGSCREEFASVEDLNSHLVIHEKRVEIKEEDKLRGKGGKVKQEGEHGTDHQKRHHSQIQQQQNLDEQKQLAKEHLREPLRRLRTRKPKTDSDTDDDQPLLRLKQQQKQKLDSDSDGETFLFTCPLCTSSYDKDDGLRRHMSAAHEARLYLCRIQKCFQKFLSLDALNTHALIDHLDRTTQCEYCSKLYASSCLPRHKRDSHRNERKPVKKAKKKAYSRVRSPPPSTRLRSPPPSTRLKSPPPSASTATIYACTMCTNKYFSFSKLSEHIRTNHRVGAQHICNVCAKIFASRSLMLNHISRTHDRTKEQHVCHHCSISYSSVTALRMHFKDVHEEGRTEVCDKCSPPRKFSSTSSLKRHIQDIHSGGMAHPCKYCPKKYACWWSLVQHTRSVHEGNSLLCKLCLRGQGSVKGRNVVYSNREELEKHMSRQHPKAKKKNSMKSSRKRVKSEAGAVKREEVVDNDVFVIEEEDEELVCNICSEEFTSQDELRAHVEDHEDDRFSCDLCFKAFLTEHKLARHVSKCDYR